jgi:glucose-6-phosphate 1-dehydrogenase
VDFPEHDGLEGRGSFYEGVGGVVPDVVQNHLLQTVASALLEPPELETPDALRRARLDLLERIAPIDRAVIGQYEGYRDVDDVDDHSTVPTLVDVELEIDAPRWEGVPVRVRTGKRVAPGPFEVTWHFTDGPTGIGRSVRARLKPQAAVHIDLAELDPNTHGAVTSVACTPTDTDHGALDAYATLLADALVGERRHMSSIDEILESWRIVDPILGAPDDLRRYAPGTPLDRVAP